MIFVECDREDLADLLAELSALGTPTHPADHMIAWHVAMAIKHQLAARRLLNESAQNGLPAASAG